MIVDGFYLLHDIQEKMKMTDRMTVQIYINKNAYENILIVDEEQV